MATTDTLLLAVTSNNRVLIGFPPSNRLDNFSQRTDFGFINTVHRIACSPDAELFCIVREDLYRGPLPSNKDVDWESIARRVGKSDWSNFKLIFFHPNGELYATTYEGEFYKGPKPDNEHITWRYQQATKIGSRYWDQYDAMFFDGDGLLYAVSNNNNFYKGSPPTYEGDPWSETSTVIGEGNWHRLSHFMAFTPDKKLWCVDRYNGNIYCGDPPTAADTPYMEKADYLGWNYHLIRFLSFVKDKVIHNIISFEFLVDEGKKSAEFPQVLAQKIYDNRRSSSTLKHTFSFQKTLRESSSFTHDHGFTFGMGIETTVKTGIPCIAEGAVKISMNMSTTHNWSLTNANETEISFSSGTEVELEAGKAIKMVASVMKAEMNVPYKAKARTLFGSEVEICGKWNGVSHYNLMVIQEDYDK